LGSRRRSRRASLEDQRFEALGLVVASPAELAESKISNGWIGKPSRSPILAPKANFPNWLTISRYAPLLVRFRGDASPR
jgi:hypothetical protein